jgi:putative flavoprotein involved in K+ transport
MTGEPRIESTDLTEPFANGMNGSAKRPSAKFDVAVIGAGQAGLAMGYFLARRGLRFVILDSADSVGAAWRTRWDSLALFTPRRYDSLPGRAFPGDPNGYPTRDEVIAYLEKYAEALELPLQLGSAVRSLREEDGGYALELDDGTIEADQVVVATGAFQAPFTPPLADRLAPDLFQTHSTGYRRPGDLPGGTVLVVGGGNTGFQIAKELSSTHAVHLSIGARQTPLPQTILGRDLFWWLTKVGLLYTSVDSRLGRKMRARETLIGSSPRELKRRHGVELRSRAVQASGRTVAFADESTLDVDAVIWATGYRPDHSWIHLPIFDQDGRVAHRRGVTDATGLYFLGLYWQHTRGSALLGWVQDDAEFIAAQIAERAEPNLSAHPQSRATEGALT